ncbi:riboflavin synthase [Marinactinospora thermotolerans]|uniref:Riboflavin synthase n=1 Tax=Marinactinospora thermotolerans DSM 45154 TaxID=1122192 RepID=A0A1T4KY16_9ACTN|nr:riboflavin synthase [Marinactinospora thermotolerans]SJZ47329.1 riboflavin synthase alpha chain [Marinactinospora thermotolerans DSM 45154]
MFTGIVEELGEVVAVDPVGTAGEAARMTIHGPTVTSDARHGDSIAVNGTCLTVTSVADGRFTADVMRETLERSSLGALVPGSPVNLERAARVSDRLGGHIVQGHVDGTGEILERVPGENWETVRISLPDRLARYVAEKGSIAVDGVSLTVVTVAPGSFGIGLIPTTLELTTLGHKGVGATVNLEVDVIAKYVERLVGVGTSTGTGEAAR